MRKTKIVSTLGPATESRESLSKLVDAGVQIFRLNMSHAQHDWVRSITKTIRTIESEKERPIGILLDTQGPAIRTGDLPEPLHLKQGDTFTFTLRGHPPTDGPSVDTNYDDLIHDLNVGDVVLVDNGVIHMKVLEKSDHELRCEVLTSGTLGSRRHINLPGIRVNLPALTQKDLQDVRLGVECGVNYIALSFAREANDIQLLQQVIHTEGASGKIDVVAKIEDQSAVRNIDEIVDAADAIMIARGDLGIEVPYEELPIIQRKIVKKCVSRRKPVIVATHMLESMIDNPVPTRAEITDVANAVFEEADAIMLSGETSIGKYPAACVQVLDRVAERIERSGTIRFHESIELTMERHRVVASAVHLADQINAVGMMIFTRTGRSARICSALRPRSSPIFAFTPDRDLVGRLTLNYGVWPFPLDFGNDPLETIDAAEHLLVDRGIIQIGSPLVLISDLILNERSYYSVQLRRVGLA